MGHLIVKICFRFFFGGDQHQTNVELGIDTKFGIVWRHFWGPPADLWQG